MGVAATAKDSQEKERKENQPELILSKIALFDKRKYKALVHYICSTCKDPSKLGSTKLHKILWLTDMLAFLNYNRPVTNEVYIKKQYGPFSSHLDNVVKELEQEKRLNVREIEWAENKKKREFIASGEPEKGLFSVDEIHLINEIRDYVCEDHTAGSISELTHDDIWKMASLNEQIPYEAILVSSLARITKEDFEWAKEEISKIQ
jgi:hypothetical protein